MLAEAHDSLRGLQEQLSQERQLRTEEADNFNQKMVQVRGAQCSPYTYSSLFPEQKAETLEDHRFSEGRNVRGNPNLPAPCCTCGYGV